MAPGEADRVSLSGDQSAAKEGAPACRQSRQAHPRTHPSRSARTTTSPKSEASSPSAQPLASTRLPGSCQGRISNHRPAQILDNFKVMLESVGSDLNHVVHVTVFLSQMGDFDAMNAAYVEKLGNHRPARTVIGVRELPKPGVLLTVNLTAVTSE
jgi:hypothetical protein